MKTTTCFFTWALGALVASLATLAIDNKADAQTNTLSDELLITAPAGAPVFFANFIPEVPPAVAAETSLTFAGGPAPAPLPIPLPVLIGLPGLSAVVLTEPAGLPPEPGEAPIVISGPNGPIFVSDVVFSTLNNQGGAPPFITLVSDGNPDLIQIADHLPGIPGVVFVPETGALQDLTALLPPQFLPAIGPLDVQVRSEVTPEPSSLVLAAFGFAGLAAWGWRRLANNRVAACR
jgi:PEP-CTERM motif-containing protein